MSSAVARRIGAVAGSNKEDPGGSGSGKEELGSNGNGGKKEEPGGSVQGEGAM